MTKSRVGLVREHVMPFGCRLTDRGVLFRLWAPGAKKVDLKLKGKGAEEIAPLNATQRGWFELEHKGASPGDHYQFIIDGGIAVPDPASRFQSGGPHGRSRVIDPKSFTWKEENQKLPQWNDMVFYELHVGTFTPEGTYQGVIEKLDYLKDLGVTAVELMPLAAFPGQFGWGYDGVLLYSPFEHYGPPDDLKALVEAAHNRGMAMFLDVVYNHFGPDGNYLYVYARKMFKSGQHTPWGEAINFDGEDSDIIRDFFIHNALFWLEEYNFDGLRMDAVFAIQDSSPRHLVREIGVQTAAQLKDRSRYLVLEGDNDTNLFRPDETPSAIRAQWNDDFHHAMHHILTGETDGYFGTFAEGKSFAKPSQHMANILTEGFSYQGQYNDYYKRNRGNKSNDLPISQFVDFLQNHDQTGNRAFGERLHEMTSVEAHRAAMGLLLLCPHPPMFWMGDEFKADTPFYFFADLPDELKEPVRNGRARDTRRREASKYGNIPEEELRKTLPDPCSVESFNASKLNWDWLKSKNSSEQSEWFAFIKNLLLLRGKHITSLYEVDERVDSEANVVETAIQVEWKFRSGKQLTLTANLGAREQKGLKLPGGNLIWSSHDTGKVLAVLPPWFVAWHIK